MNEDDVYLMILILFLFLAFVFYSKKGKIINLIIFFSYTSHYLYKKYLDNSNDDDALVNLFIFEMSLITHILITVFILIGNKKKWW